MGRVAWDGIRVRRLSAGAFTLLHHMCPAGSRVVYVHNAGTYHLMLGECVRQQVSSRTLEVLIGPRLVLRDKATSYASYVISEHGRDLLQQYLSARCEALGHPDYCEQPECRADAC